MKGSRSIKYFKAVICLAAWLLQMVFSGAAADAGNPYATIATRNVFVLNPSDSSAPSTPGESLPVITPNGIISIFGSLQTLFKVTSNQPGQPFVQKSYILGEGQREDDIQIIKIDEKNALIVFKNHGVLQQLPLAAVTASANPTNEPETASAGSVIWQGKHFTGAVALALRNQMPPGQSINGASEIGSKDGSFVIKPAISVGNDSGADSQQLKSIINNETIVDFQNILTSNDTKDGELAKAAARRLADLRMILFAQQRMQ